MTSDFAPLPRSRYGATLRRLNRENAGDQKVLMLREVDMTAAERLRGAANREGKPRPSYTALIVKAASLALRRHPHANRIVVGRGPLRRRFQLGTTDVTVAVERDVSGEESAVFAGTLRGADDKDLTALTSELRTLADATPETVPRWRLFRTLVERLPSRVAAALISLPTWSPELWVEHRGGAVLVSSPAKYGPDVMAAAWPWPLGLSFGFVRERPWAEHGVLSVRPTMTVTFSFDRTLLGGAPAARFFESLCRFVEQADTALLKKGRDVKPSGEYEAGPRNLAPRAS